MLWDTDKEENSVDEWVPVSQLVLAVGVTGLTEKGNKPSPAPEKHTGAGSQTHKSVTNSFGWSRS